MVCLGPAAGEVDSTTDRLYNMVKSQTRILYHLSGSGNMTTLHMFVVTACIPHVVRLHITYTVLKVHGLELDQDVVVTQSHSMHTI